MNVENAGKDKEVEIVRVFRASREKVFHAWSDKAALESWFAPNGCSVEIKEIDFRVGGRILYCIRHPQHGGVWAVGEYREIEVPGKIVMLLSLSDERGNVSRGGHIHHGEGWPISTLLSLAFTEKNGATTMTLRQGVSEALAKKIGAYPSWLQMFDRLDGFFGALVAEEPTLEIIRVFDAPRALVFRAWTDPAHLVRWWGPQGFTSPACKVDLRVGGRFHFCMRSPDGQEYWNAGEYREIVVPERIVSTMWFSDAAGAKLKPSAYGFAADFPEEMHDMVTFEEIAGGKTRLTLRRATPISISKKYMEDKGWSSSLDKFDELLRELAGR